MSITNYQDKEIAENLKCCDGGVFESGHWLHRKTCPVLEKGPFNGLSLCPEELEITKQVKKQKEEEAVVHPAHYNFGKFEVIDVLEDWFSTNPLLWQVGKYIARAGRKSNELEDLKKARWYLDRQIMKMEAELVKNKV